MWGRTPIIALASGGGPITISAGMGATARAAMKAARPRVAVSQATATVQREGASGGGAPRSSQAPISGVTRTMAMAVSTSPAPQRRPSWRTALISESASAPKAAAAVMAAHSTARVLLRRAAAAASAGANPARRASSRAA